MLGDWDHPYTTMAFKNEADEIRTLGRILEKGFLYRGLKPVNWCFDCGSALAEAEVEYEDRDDIAIDVASRSSTRERGEARARRSALDALPEGPMLRGDLDDDAVDAPGQPGAERRIPTSTTRSWTTPRGHLVLAQDLVEACLARYKLEGHDRRDRAKGAALELHRASAIRSTTARRRCTSATT